VKRWICWAVKLYPQSWRDRYESELASLVEHLTPSWRDLFDVLTNAVTIRGSSFVERRLLALPGVGVISDALRLRSALLLTIALHAILVASVFIGPWLSYSALPLDALLLAPSPPPAPQPPTDITDPRVMCSVGVPYSSILSSLPPSLSGSRLVEGVGICFPTLPDMGTVYRNRKPMRRVWPSQALESSIVSRAIPKVPRGISSRDKVSVFLEYLIATDGSVKVLRTLGLAPFVESARSALERWHYRPVRFENQNIEVVSRVEVRFVPDLQARNDFR